MATSKKQRVETAASLSLSQTQVLWLSAAFTALYFVYSFISDGFYQDDEIGHYQNMRLFWTTPATILGNWAKPGFKLFYVIPALAGYRAVLFMNAAITGLMVFVSWKLAKEAAIKNDALVPVLCGFQPMLFQLSFRTYSELITAVLLALLVLSVLRNKTWAAAFLGTYLFTIRQELALLAPFVFIWLVYKKAWKAIPLMALPLLGLVWAGWAAHGDPLWVFLEASSKGTDQNFVRQGFFHYFKMFVPVFGSITTVLFLPGLLASIETFRNDPQQRIRHVALLVPFLVYFLIHGVLTSEFANMSASAGNLRYMVVLSPIVAVFAALGFDKLRAARDFTGRYWLTAAAMLALVLVFFSYHYNHLLYTPARDESRWFAALLFLGFLAWSRAKTLKPLVLTAIFSFMVIAATLYNEPPKKNSPENEAVKVLANWMQGRNLMDRRVLINHPMFYFYGGRQLKKPYEKYPGLFLETLKNSPAGTIAIWDSHYSDRPEYKMDVPYTWFESHPAWKKIQQITSADRRYIAIVYEKTE